MSETPASESVFIIWSSGDPEVARNLAFMYAHNSLRNGWWERVRLIIWGPSARLACQDPDIAERIRTMIRDGVEVWACRSCADNYGPVRGTQGPGRGRPVRGRARDRHAQGGLEPTHFLKNCRNTGKSPG